MPNGIPKGFRLSNRKIEKVLAIRAELPKRFPEAFSPKGAKPLKRGVHRELAAAFGQSPFTCSLAIRPWVRSNRYLRALVQGGDRYELDGTPCGETVTEEHKELAMKLLADREEKKGAAELTAYDIGNGRNLVVWCPHCKQWHRHGMGLGHRAAHCSKAGSPFKAAGYTLVGGEPAPDWVIKDILRKKPLGPTEPTTT